jgi:phosphinothricin acetyltransferase
MLDFEIRDAKEADLAGVFAIYDREVLHGTATFDTEPKTVEQRVAWLRDHSKPRRCALVAVGRTPGTKVLGWASLSAWSERCAYARAAENSVYVAAEARGRGVGKALLAALVARARADGLAVLLARIVEGNPASRRLHLAAGFRSIGVMHGVGEKLGRVLDVELFELPLAPG